LELPRKKPGIVQMLAHDLAQFLRVHGIHRQRTICSCQESQSPSSWGIEPGSGRLRLNSLINLLGPKQKPPLATGSNDGFSELHQKAAFANWISLVNKSWIAAWPGLKEVAN
jgi:hypothetical protein